MGFKVNLLIRLGGFFWVWRSGLGLVGWDLSFWGRFGIWMNFFGWLVNGFGFFGDLVWVLDI